MAVMMEREGWTDERLDEAFGRVDADIRELRLEMKRGFERVDDRFDSVNQRFDAMQRTMIIGFVTLFAGIVASVIGGVFAAITLG